MAKFANSRDPDQTPRSAASDLGLHCLSITLLGVSRLQWAVEQCTQCAGDVFVCVLIAKVHAWELHVTSIKCFRDSVLSKGMQNRCTAWYKPLSKVRTCTTRERLWSVICNEQDRFRGDLFDHSSPHQSTPVRL